MPVAKIVFFMFSLDNGWTEEYRRTVTNLSDLVTVPGGQPGAGVFRNVPAANTPLGQLMVLRTNLTPPTIGFQRVRVSLEGAPRTFQIYYFVEEGYLPGAYKRAPLVIAARAATEDWTALAVELTGQAAAAAGGFQFQGRLFMHGMPEEVFTPPRSYTPANTGHRNDLQSFLNLLSSGPYLLETRSRINTPNVPNPVPITQFNPDAEGYTAAVAPIPLLPPAQPGGQPQQPTPNVPFYVVIRGRRSSEWNGVHRAVWTGGAATTITIGPARRRFREITGVATLVPGTIQYLLTQDTPINTYHIDQFLEHRVGRFFGQLVGRRRAR